MEQTDTNQTLLQNILSVLDDCIEKGLISGYGKINVKDDRIDISVYPITTIKKININVTLEQYVNQNS